jgi:malonyl-CoA O-methyltransferase
MSSSAPPTLDPVAVKRFRSLQSAKNSAWLHTEVAKRMVERLSWFKHSPKSWVDWEPINGGTDTHAIIQKRYPGASEWVIEYNTRRLQEAKRLLTPSWIDQFLSVIKNPKLFSKGKTTFALNPPTAGMQVDLVWANMLLHLEPNPTELIKSWHKSLRVGGWVMFSCLGPDTCQELRKIYARLGWTAPAHEFTDMHDWGDMLVESGFADPVMDMERITLTYSSPESLIQDLRGLGANFNYNRFNALRGKRWLQELKTQLINSAPAKNELDSASKSPAQSSLTFEIIYGHAFKVAPKIKMSESTAFSAEDMRSMLKAGKQ